MAVTLDAGAEADRQIRAVLGYLERAVPALEAAVDYANAHQRQAGAR